MVTAYIMVIVKPGSEIKVAERLMREGEVKDIAIVYGEYDIIMKVEVETMEDLQKFLSEKVRAIDEVEKTTTLIAWK